MIREYFLFRDVEHSGISSTPRIDSARFRNFGNSVQVQLQAIPSDSGITVVYMYTKLSHVYNRSDSGIGIAGNWKEFPGIPRNSVQFRFSLIPEFRFGIAFRPHPHVRLCACRLFIGISKQFRKGIPELKSLGIRRNSLEFRGIPSTCEIAVPYMYTKLSHVYNRSDSGFIQCRNSRPESDHH